MEAWVNATVSCDGKSMNLFTHDRNCTKKHVFLTEKEAVERYQSFISGLAVNLVEKYLHERQ